MTVRSPSEVLVITRSDIVRTMTTADYLAASEQAFRAAAAGKANSPFPMHLPVERGGFHAKGASIELDRHYVALKLNGNFPSNRAELGLPTIQGAILLADGDNGSLLAILDSTEVTLRRTAAASACAAKHLARADSRVLLLCGCGEQGQAHAAALRQVLPIERCLLWDCDRVAAERLAADLGRDGTMQAESISDLASGSRCADVIAACTTAGEPFLDLEMVNPGAFIAAVGADSPTKSEITPRLMAAATVVTDVTDQCADMGDLRHALDTGSMTRSDVHAELGQVITGARPGRRSPAETIIFDSTGTGVQDAAAAAAIYQRYRLHGAVRSVALAQ